MSTLSSMMATNRRDRATRKFKSANERLMKEIPKSTHKEMSKLRIMDLDTIPGGDVESKAQHIQKLSLSVLKAREDFKENRTRFEKVVDTAGMWFVKLYPCLNSLIETGKGTGRVFDPYGLAFSGLVILATTAKGVIERAAQIDDPLDFLERELRSIEIGKDVSSGISKGQLATGTANCAALEFSAAISSFLACVIHDRLRSSPRRVASTIFKGPPPIVQLRNETFATKKAYIEAFTLNSGKLPSLHYTESESFPDSEMPEATHDDATATSQGDLAMGSTLTLVEEENAFAISSEEIDVELLHQARLHYLDSLKAVEQHEDDGVTEGLTIWSHLAEVSILLWEQTHGEADMDEVLGTFQTLEKRILQNLQPSATLVDTILSRLKSLMWCSSGKGLSASSPINMIIKFLQDIMNTSSIDMGESASDVPSLERNTVELAEAQYRRYCVFGDISDLDNAFKILSELSVSDEELFQYWGPVYSTVCLARYSLTGSPELLHSAIETSEKGLATCDLADLTFTPFVLPFITALTARFEAEGTLFDLDKAFSLIDAPSGSFDPFNSLAVSETLRLRGKETGSIEDVQNSLTYSEEVLSDETIRLHSSYSAYLALAKHTTYEFKGSLSTLEEAISLFRTSLEDILVTAPFRCRAVYQFSFLLSDYFDHIGDIKTIDECIELLRGCLPTAADKERRLPDYLLSLSDALYKRYKSQKSSEDLELALEYSRKALELNGRLWISDVFHSTRGRILLAKFITLNNFEDLDSAITQFRHSVELSSHHRGAPNQAKALHDLSKALRIDFERTKKVSTIDEAVEYASKAIDLLPEICRETVGFEFELARCLFTKYGACDEREVLKQASEVMQRVVEGSEEDSLNRGMYLEFFATVKKAQSVGDTVDEVRMEEDISKGASRVGTREIVEDATPKAVDPDELAEHGVESQKTPPTEDMSISERALEDGTAQEDDSPESVVTENPRPLSDKIDLVTPKEMTSRQEDGRSQEADEFETDQAEANSEVSVSENPEVTSDEAFIPEPSENVHELPHQGTRTVEEKNVISETTEEGVVEEVNPAIFEPVINERYRSIESEEPLRQSTVQIMDGALEKESISRELVPEEALPAESIPNDDKHEPEVQENIHESGLFPEQLISEKVVEEEFISTRTFPDNPNQILPEVADHSLPQEVRPTESVEESTVPKRVIPDVAVEYEDNEVLSENTSEKMSDTFVEGNREAGLEATTPSPSCLPKNIVSEHPIEEQSPPEQAIRHVEEGYVDQEGAAHAGARAIPENPIIEGTVSRSEAQHIEDKIGKHDGQIKDISTSIPSRPPPNYTVTAPREPQLEDNGMDAQPVAEVVDLSEEMRRAMSMSPWVFQGLVGCVLIIIWTYRRFREQQ